LTLAEVADLYRVFGRRLHRIVRGGVRASDPIVEDACQFAWSRLMHHRGRVHREKALSWLVTTALHEALKLVERADRDLSLETELEQGAQFAASRVNRTPEMLVEDRERLRALTSLPQCQQRVLWLYGVGLSYEEIACRQGCTARAVERQLQNARAALRERA
jgi:RNA polymerase sigma factor (sigma-70 family)